MTAPDPGAGPGDAPQGDGVTGFVAPGYEPVAAAFRANFRAGHEVGAALAIFKDGAPVVDLWGGLRDRDRGLPWRRDTPVLVFSATKGVAALPLAILRARGLLDYDAPVAEYWPEFAQRGKAAITVRQLLSHQAGLCALDTPVTLELLADLDALAAVLARQAPAWEPGARLGYHGVTLGWYEGELVRRVDPAGRSLGRFLQDEVCGPLGIRFHVGLPPEQPEDHRAQLVDYHPVRGLLHTGASLPWRFVLGILWPGSITYKTLRNPAVSRLGDWNTRPMLAVEIPAGNGVGEARAIARAYSCLATGGAELGLDAATIRGFTEPAPPPRDSEYDMVLHLPVSRYALGFAKPIAQAAWFTSPASFGAFGAGGSFGFADPEVGVGYAYTPNRMGFVIWNDPREHRIRDALYRCLGKRPPGEAP